MSASHTITRSMPDRSFVMATLEVRQPGGLLSPGFSLTGAIYEPHGTWSGEAQWRNGREPDTFGAIGSEIVRAFPWIAPFAAVHLADLDGTPMHAVANACYFLTDLTCGCHD